MIDKIETPAVVQPAAKQSTPAANFSIDPLNKAPGLWEISAQEDGTIRAVHSMVGQVFVGSMADFNAAMAI
jgi:hypothetical protein